MVNCLNESLRFAEEKICKIQANIHVINAIICLQFIWLLAICLLPENIYYLKLSLTAVLCINSFLLIITSKRSLINSYMAYTLLFVIIYFMFLLYGVINGYAFDYKLIEIFCVRPIVLFLLVKQIDSKEKFKYFMMSLIIITFIIILYNVIYMLGIVHILPKIIFWENGAVIITDVFLAIRVSNQGTLMFLLPMNIILFADIKNILYTIKIRIIISINILLGTIVVLFSGRRTLQLVTLIAFTCLFFFLIAKIKIDIMKILRYLIMTCFAVFLCLVIIQFIGNLFGLKDLYRSVFSTFFDAVNSGEHTSTVRQSQLFILIHEWLRKPILGWGLSAYVPYFIRSATSKWSYEYVYIAFLFQTGLVGFLTLSVYIVNIIKRMFVKYHLNRNNEYGIFFLACIIGFVCFLIAGFTNPLIASLWGWFIALVCANIMIENG